MKVWLYQLTACPMDGEETTIWGITYGEDYGEAANRVEAFYHPDADDIKIIPLPDECVQISNTSFFDIWGHREW